MAWSRGGTGWVAGLGCVLTLMTQMPCLPVEEGSPAAATSEEPASLLSPGEQQYISGRKQRVTDSLQKLGISVNMASVPHVALLGSGGGQRAAVALLGSLHQMEQDHLLDTLLYLGGVSGSGWAMSFLYTDPLWSTNMATALARLTGSSPKLDDIVDWLDGRSKDKHFSLSDFWGAILSPTIMKQLDRHHLSDEANRDTTNPYPVYCALEQNCQLNGSTKGKWFELTPHESGFTELNVFIPTSQLGSSEAGEVKGAEVREGEVKGSEVGKGMVKGAEVGEGEVKGAEVEEGEVKGAEVEEGEVKGAEVEEWEVKGAEVGEGEVKASEVGEREVKGAGGVMGENGVEGEKGAEGVEVGEGEEQVKGLDWVGEVGRGSDMDMVSLQGIIGSAMANEKNFLEYLPEWLRGALGVALINENNMLDIFLWKDGTRGAEGIKGANPEVITKVQIRELHILAQLLAVVGENTEDPFARAKLEQLRAPLQDFLNSRPVPSMRLVNSQERKMMFNNWMEETLKPIREWAVTLKDGPVKDFVSWVVFKLFPLIERWEWGTTDNFLYQSKDGAVPECLRSKESIHLIDAGMYLNSPFPPFLGPKRDMDLLISLDFSLGESLTSLTLARDYAAEVQKPFPVIDDKVLEDKDWPKDYYVFPGGLSQPTIVYMPLFNQRNCRDAAEVKAKMAEYTTVQWPYNEEKIAALLKIAMANMKNNKSNILNEINKAAIRKHNRRYAASVMSKTQRKVDG